MKKPLPWFLLCLATVLYFALVPVPPSGRLQELPRPIANWLNAHDDLANCAVFGVLSVLTFALPPATKGAGRIGGIQFAVSPTKVRLAGLLALVAGLEFAQLGIQGRESDWRDVVMGLIGVLGAWLIHQAWVKRFGRARGATQFDGSPLRSD